MTALKNSAASNQEANTNSIASQFLNTNRGKTKSNAIEVPTLTLPKGGGAVRGIDEKFSVNAVNGSAAFSFPLPFSNARGITPTLSLSYNSAAGNSIFGLGWNLALSSIKRKSDKQLALLIIPLYQQKSSQIHIRIRLLINVLFNILYSKNRTCYFI